MGLLATKGPPVCVSGGGCRDGAGVYLFGGRRGIVPRPWHAGWRRSGAAVHAFDLGRVHGSSGLSGACGGPRLWLRGARAARSDPGSRRGPVGGHNGGSRLFLAPRVARSGLTAGEARGGRVPGRSSWCLDRRGSGLRSHSPRAPAGRRPARGDRAARGTVSGQTAPSRASGSPVTATRSAPCGCGTTAAIGRACCRASRIGGSRGGRTLVERGRGGRAEVAAVRPVRGGAAGDCAT